MVEHSLHNRPVAGSNPGCSTPPLAGLLQFFVLIRPWFKSRAQTFAPHPTSHPQHPLQNVIQIQGDRGLKIKKKKSHWGIVLSGKIMILQGGGIARTAAPLPTEAEPPPQGGGGHRGAASQRPRTGGGDPSQPTASRRSTAIGKRPVQAGSPGLSTPSKPKRGRGVAGAGVAGRAPTQGHHRPAAARGLFALGFTRTAAVTSPRDGEQGGALALPRGADTPGKGQGRARGPSLTPCTLRVRLGGRHIGSATSCFCADPCTHTGQDLNRLLCTNGY